MLEAPTTGLTPHPTTSTGGDQLPQALRALLGAQTNEHPPPPPPPADPNSNPFGATDEALPRWKTPDPRGLLHWVLVLVLGGDAAPLHSSSAAQ